VEQVWFVLRFVLHGYGYLASRFLKYFEILDDGTRLLVAPEALSRFYLDPEVAQGTRPRRVGASWMTREDRLSEIHDYVRYLDTLAAQVLSAWSGPSPRVVVLGFSQGAATAARWVATGGVTTHRLVLWAGGLPPDLDLGKSGDVLSGAALTLVVGTRDAYVSREVREDEEQRLRANEVRFELHSYDGGHEIHPEQLLKLARSI
jgi:predicted esterase